jgi:hypothetical protein
MPDDGLYEDKPTGKQTALSGNIWKNVLKSYDEGGAA